MFSALVVQNVLTKRGTVLQWAVTFLVVALIAGLLGFGGVAAVSEEMAKILFFVFIILFLIAMVAHVVRGRMPPA